MKDLEECKEIAELKDKADKLNARIERAYVINDIIASIANEEKWNCFEYKGKSETTDEEIYEVPTPNGDSYRYMRYKVYEEVKDALRKMM